MNRRKSIKRIMTFSIGIGVFGYGGWEAYHVYKTPDLNYLRGNIDFLASIVDTIIPETSTIGAKRANVHAYVLLMVTECYGKKEQNNFINGLQSLQKTCINTYGNSFENCSATQRLILLDDYNKESSNSFFSKVSKKVFGNSFFNILKKLTIEGYCTSEDGAKKQLAYQYVPGNYLGIIPLNKNQRSWATK